MCSCGYCCCCCCGNFCFMSVYTVGARRRSSVPSRTHNRSNNSTAQQQCGQWNSTTDHVPRHTNTHNYTTAAVFVHNKTAYYAHRGCKHSASDRYTPSSACHHQQQASCVTCTWITRIHAETHHDLWVLEIYSAVGGACGSKSACASIQDPPTTFDQEKLPIVW